MMYEDQILYKTSNLIIIDSMFTNNRGNIIT